jgi:hypothetical protein
MTQALKMTFVEYLTNHLDSKFEWGKCDCVTFAIGWMEIKHNKDFLSQYKPWTSAKEALRIVDSLGGLVKMFNDNLEQINPLLAQDGDITFKDKTTFLFSGNNIVGVGENGLVHIDRMEATCAWR